MSSDMYLITSNLLCQLITAKRGMVTQHGYTTSLLEGFFKSVLDIAHLVHYCMASGALTRHTVNIMRRTAQEGSRMKRRMTKFEKQARLLGITVAWCHYMGMSSRTITLGEIANRLNVSKSTARRTARTMADEMPCVELRYTDVLGCLVLVVDVPDEFETDSALEPYYRESYLSETVRLYSLFGEPEPRRALDEHLTLEYQRPDGVTVVASRVDDREYLISYAVDGSMPYWTETYDSSRAAIAAMRSVARDYKWKARQDEC